MTNLNAGASLDSGDNEQFYSTAEAAKLLGVSHRTIQLWVEAGTLQAWKTAGGHRRIASGSVERLLLCSDGVTGMIEDQEIEGILETVPDPRDAADRLVRAAVAAGGRDNATAIVVDVVGLVHDASYDSQRQRQSLESKLGGRQ